MKKNIDQKFLNQNGQALFEMILFLPFLMFLYTIYYTAGNSISGSINQQKAVRGYYYALEKGNSYIVPYTDLKSFRDKGTNKVGFNSVGWNQHLASGSKGEQSFAPCFKFSSFLKNNSTETCDGSDREAEDMSRFVRLFTFYGVCGPYYTQNNFFPDYFEIDPSAQAYTVSCTLGK
ncbi:MAG: hypothetical protein Q7U04_11230 [Bacteriovorax sp.]|nr:hypothetical protein [Bacteriovorax sp.]